MKRYLTLLLLGATGLAQAAPTCSAAWYESIEQQLTTADTQGHGPDLGSDEWKSVIEFKLGVRDKAEVPQRNSEQWCQYIKQKVDAINSKRR
ncbi:hypothetical protein [Pseudomonas sp. efr-133-TYG-5]|uniref:hypothetical protein n=1 Tax=Pseudomonas sp. efr-133-TYG-5 TaxID=3040310 RepID=UPI002555CDF0|nr:hypothetical protein [Pseudomonas sp. efr-133-TYG-5]